MASGGHRQAAGLRLQAGMVEKFRDALSGLVKAQVPEFRGVLKIDADISFGEVNFNLVKELSMLEPFGFGNPEPLFGTKALQVVNPRIVGNGHLKMKLKQRKNHLQVDAIGFDMAGMMGHLEDSLTVDAAFTPVINEWDGGRVLQLNLKGLRPSA